MIKSSVVATSLTLLIIQACGNPVRQRPSEDFKILATNAPEFDQGLPKEPFTPEGCRARIEKLLCLVDPAPEGASEKPRPCVFGEDLSSGARALEKIYDAYPLALKRIFCDLNRIYVEREFYGTAYAGTDPSGEQVIMGIRASLLLAQPIPHMTHWITWKEQLSFGGRQDSYETRDDLVKVVVNSQLPNEANDFLHFVIAHEIGHLLDFRYHVNDFVCPADTDSSSACTPKAGSWSALSWKAFYPQYKPTDEDPWGLSYYEPNKEASFAHRDQLCFYGCKPGHGSPELAPELYKELERSSLLTTYSATNAYDDFAEALAFYVSTQAAPWSYQVILTSGENYDLAQKFLHAPQYQAKREWLEQFISRIQ